MLFVIVPAAAAVLWYLLMLFLPAGKQNAKDSMVWPLGLLISGGCWLTEYSLLQGWVSLRLFLRLAAFGFALLLLVRIGMLFVTNRKSIAAWWRKHNTDDRPYRKRMLAALLPTLLLVYMYDILGTAEVFFGNVSEWTFIYSDVIIAALIKCGIVIGVLGFLLPVFVRGQILNVYILLCSALDIASYLQGLFMNYQVSLLNGEDVPWLEHTVFALVNMLIWLAILVVPLLLYRRFRKRTLQVIAGATGFLLAIQLVPYPMLLLQAPENAYTHKENETVYDVDGAPQFHVSEQQNVMVFILDAYGKEAFDALLSEDASYRKTFCDYTYYHNMNSEYCSTMLSLPSMLTATEVDFTQSIDRSNQAAWSSENADAFYTAMHDNGYLVNLYTDSEVYAGGAENMLGKIDNIKEFMIRGYDTDRFATYWEMLNISRYKLVPYFLKCNFWANSSIDANKHTKRLSDKVVTDTSDWEEATDRSLERGVCFNNYEYYKGLRRNGLRPDSKNKYCVFEHVHGLHEPYQDYRGETDGVESARRGCLELVIAYMDQMKKRGLYDNSTIIITADHGDHDHLVTNPVFLIKTPGETHDLMQVNEAPGNLQTDLLPTILDSIGLPYEHIGMSLLDMDEDMSRERYKYNLARSSNLPRVKKCNAAGYLYNNCTRKLTFNGNINKITIDTDDYVEEPIGPQWY